MDQLTKILVPVDLSKRSERALAYAALLAGACGADLVLATNVSHEEHAALNEYAKREGFTITEAAEATLARLASHHAPGLTSSVVVRFADSAAAGILEAVESSGADAIVMASHGRSGMTRWALGSVTEKIIRTADIPVTVIPARDS